MSIKSLEQWEKGYIAGVIDSDGAFLIRRIGKSFSFYCSIQFVGTFEQMVKIRGMMGLNSKKIHQHNNRWMFLVGEQSDVVSIIKRLWDFLTKKPEARLILDMRDLHDKGNSSSQKGKLPQESVIKARLDVFRRYKTFKARSGGHVINWDEFEESLTDAYQASQGNPEPSIQELLGKLSFEDTQQLLEDLKVNEGVETRPEIKAG